MPKPICMIGAGSLSIGAWIVLNLVLLWIFLAIDHFAFNGFGEDAIRRIVPRFPPWAIWACLGLGLLMQGGRFFFYFYFKCRKFWGQP